MGHQAEDERVRVPSAQWRLTPCEPIDCSLPDSSVQEY